MKNTIVLLLMTIFLITSCKQNATENVLEMTVIDQNETFNVSSKKGLKDLAKHALKEDIKSFDGIKLTKTSDSEGEFYMVFAKVVNQKNENISLAIPLTKSTDKVKSQNNNVSIYSMNCVMTSNRNADCKECKHIIYERCKKQACSCERQKSNNEIGKCSVSVTF